MRDIPRILLLLVLTAAALIALDTANVVVFQSLLIGVFIVGGTHITRRILFNKLDLQSIALRAVEEKNTPAAIVFCAIVAFLVAVMYLSLVMLK